MISKLNEETSPLRAPGQDLKDVDLSPYLDIQYSELTINRDDASNPEKRQFFEHRQCVEEDFAFSEEAKKIFRSFTGQFLACPSSSKDGQLQGYPGQRLRKVLDIDFKRCNTRAPGNRCAREGDINLFIEDMSVDTYAIYGKLDT